MFILGVMAENPANTKHLKAFGKRVAAVRRDRGITQDVLADKADISSLTVSYIESGRQWPRLATLKKIAKALDVTVADLFKGI